MKNTGNILYIPLLILIFFCGFSFKPGEQKNSLEEVPLYIAGDYYDSIHFELTSRGLKSVRDHNVLYDGKPAEDRRVSGFKHRMEWDFSTPEPGDYIVTIFAVTDKKRSVKFGFYDNKKEYSLSKVRKSGLIPKSKQRFAFSFKIRVTGTTGSTRMYISGKSLVLYKIYIAAVKPDTPVYDNRFKKLTPSGYKTILSGNQTGPRALVVLPPSGPARQTALEFAARTGLPKEEEKKITIFPGFSTGGTKNLILFNLDYGTPLCRSLKNADILPENRHFLLEDGYEIRTIARPFRENINLLVLSARTEKSLAECSRRFLSLLKKEKGTVFFDTFLELKKGTGWAKFAENRIFETGYAERMEKIVRKNLPRPFGGYTGPVPSREYIQTLAALGQDYFTTANPVYAALFKAAMLKMMDDDIYGHLEKGMDSHMVLYELLLAWDRAEEAPVFTAQERLLITNYLFFRCLLANEGFLRTFSTFERYSDGVKMRHNHQTHLALGLTRGYLYFERLYDPGITALLKSWCNEQVENAVYWGHAPEDSANYEQLVFLHTAKQLRIRGLDLKTNRAAQHWPEAARRFLILRDSFLLPAAYGDCWDSRSLSHFSFFRIMEEEFGEKRDFPAQYLIDRLIENYKTIENETREITETFIYLNGSAEVGGIQPVPDKKKALEYLDSVTGLIKIRLPEGYFLYQTGQIGNKQRWKKYQMPRGANYALTADKIQFRSGFGPGEEYLLFEGIGWADHGHYDLGSIVHYNQGDRLWIVDFGYNNVEARHHSNLEIMRDGKPLWTQFPFQEGRFGDFRTGSQFMEITDFRPPGMKKEDYSFTGKADFGTDGIWERTITGTPGGGFSIHDSFTAVEEGEYEVTFRLRLLGLVEGKGQKWQVRQQGALLPLSLSHAPGDSVTLRKWEPDDHGWDGGAYPWYKYNLDEGNPKTLEWTKKVHLAEGEQISFIARIGKVQAE